MTKKVLIADDEQNIVISLDFLLRREGFDVLVAADGEEALAKARSERPDLVLLDVMMPKMNGFDVCQALRADPELASMRVLMLTAKGRDTEVTKGLGLGADAYMTKPFSTKELVAQVRSLLVIGLAGAHFRGGAAFRDRLVARLAVLVAVAFGVLIFGFTVWNHVII